MSVPDFVPAISIGSAHDGANTRLDSVELSGARNALIQRYFFGVVRFVKMAPPTSGPPTYANMGDDRKLVPVPTSFVADQPRALIARVKPGDDWPPH